MQLEYFFFYMEANLVSIVIMAMLLLHDRKHGTRQEKQIWFNKTVVMHILYFFTDIFWAAMFSGVLPRTRFLVALLNLLNFALLSLITFEWFMYMAASENIPFRKNRRLRSMWRIPMTVMILALVISYAAAPGFWISETGELNSLYYPMMVAAPILYLLAAFVFSVISARKTESREEKRLYRLIGIYPLGVLASGLLQMFALNAPLFCFGCTVLLLYFYIQNMQTLVSVDSLTRLNNRGQINRYMDQMRYKENARIYTMMIDVNKFKEINDTYGHAEGDRALILVAEALRKSCERAGCPVFLGRYGGDEFTIFIQNPENDTIPELMADAIRNGLQERQQKNRLPYDLKVSIGWEALRDKDDTLEACIIRADEKLYSEKRAGEHRQPGGKHETERRYRN